MNKLNNPQNYNYMKAIKLQAGDFNTNRNVTDRNVITENRCDKSKDKYQCFYLR